MRGYVHQSLPLNMWIGEIPTKTGQLGVKIQLIVIPR